MTNFPPPGQGDPLPPPGPPGPPPGFPAGFPSGPPQRPYNPSPLTPSHFSVLSPGSPEPSPPVWKKWWFIVGSLAVAGGIIAAVVVSTSNDDTDVAGFDPDDITIPSINVTIPDFTIPNITIPDFTIPQITIPGITIPEFTIPQLPEGTTPTEGVPEATSVVTTPSGPTSFVVGDAVDVEAGTRVRLNTVTPNAPPLDDFFQPDPGTSLTRLDIEGCAGGEGLYLDPFYWIGFLDDNTSVDAFIFGGDTESLTVAPGACVRGRIDLQVPDGKTLSSVVMRGGSLNEVARWDVSSSIPVIGPLVAQSPVTTASVNEVVTFDDGSTAVLKSATPNAPPLDEFFPPDPGRQLVRVEVELCAGSAPLSVGPYYWFAAATDNRLGSSTFSGSTLETLEIAAGQCSAGLVELDLPADATLGSIVYADESLTELARWSAA